MARLARATDLVQAEIELEEVKEALRGWDDAKRWKITFFQDFSWVNQL